MYARRGTITDRNGIELAVSEDATTVFANPFLIDDPAGVAQRARAAAGHASRTRSWRSWPTARRASSTSGASSTRRAARRSAGSASRGSARSSSRAGPIRRARSRRRCSGSVGTDNYGLSGLEQSHEETLHGTDGQRKIVKDATGKPVSIVDVERAEAGDDMRLTIDAAIQERTEAVLSEVGQLYQPRGATAVVMDPRNGEVLAMANWPRVDANKIGEAPEYARVNRAVGFTYEPGSTFKAFTVAGALEERLVTPRTQFTIGPTIQVADRTIGEAHDGGGGTLTVADILAQSSNVGTVTIGLKMGTEKFDAWVRRFGFSEPTGIDLPGEEAGIVPTVEEYSGSSIGNLPIGQGLSVTPIQMAYGYSAIANGGIAHTPHVIAGEPDEGAAHHVGRERRRRSRACSRACSRRAARRARRRSTATRSRARRAPRRRRRTAATRRRTTSRRSSASRRHAARACSVSVMVDEPRGSIYGGEVAAPAFEKIASFALPYLKIPPQ